MNIHVPNQEALSPKPIPEGIYKGRITNVKITTSSKGNPTLLPEVTIMSESGDPSQKTIGRKVFDNWTFTEDSLGVVNAKYKGCTGEGLPEGDFAIDELLLKIQNNILNKEVVIRVAIEQYEGVFRNKVKEYKRP